MDQVRFRAAIVVEGELYRDGDIELASSIPAGTLDSMLRLGQVVPYDPDAVDSAGSVEEIPGDEEHSAPQDAEQQVQTSAPATGKGKGKGKRK